MSNILSEMAIGGYILACTGVDCAIIAQNSNNPFPHDMSSVLTLIILLIIGSVGLEFIDYVLSP